MSEKRISLADGFEDLLGTLRGLAGECPSAGEMTRVDGSESGLGRRFYRGLIQSGEAIAEKIAKLDAQLAEVQSNMTAAIADQRETDAAIAEDLQRMLADLEGMHTDVSGEGTAAPGKAAPGETPKSRKY
ncbi:hypothetical protein [Leucobacter chromiiresistens]|uniref:Uncharacterized protein n=1 Tax=Leucobacter chromiiresistens TaxID=1079994 RepID=A0A147EH62_9MICO|nr:hypothetical protein [Leucobacter chromiiresistens]KTR83712.1 hypothetical protein NS354_10255 [Leucobacter chromiiresistens]